MVAILSRIFTGPNITFFTILGMCIMVLGGIVCFCAEPIKRKITGRPAEEKEIIPIKLAGLVIAIIGLIVTVYMKG